MNRGINTSILDNLLCSSSSSSEDETILSSNSETTDMEEHVKINTFILIINEYSEADFEEHFRLKRSTAHFLIEIYKTSNNYKSVNSRERRTISAEAAIYMFLWYISSTEPFRTIAKLFDVCVSSAWKIINGISRWIISIGHNYVKWPSTEEAISISSKFEAKRGIFNIIGAIDCSHIRIKAPRENKENYFNEKHAYSIHLQGIVDADKKFIDIYCGEPGSLHNSSVLRRSAFYEKVFHSQDTTFLQNGFLIGDSAYSNFPWIVTPYEDSGFLTVHQKRFNELISTTSIVVEYAFGLLKTRFRRLLHFTEQTNINFIVNLTVCACILHNICLIVENDETKAEQNVSDANSIKQESNLNTFSATDSCRREILYEELLSRNLI